MARKSQPQKAQPRSKQQDARSALGFGLQAA
ncbi:hypothetical protein F4556_004667 [Kitasatospora gansuensis]|uniref:Uncharacterized protein n=1 Tax=Kitasatospora gansuensis TaxID=258050 RepID=A0A7W7SFH8_9ACTN|nr:hypothetical protein [Kitasatospora gansuensis]